MAFLRPDADVLDGNWTNQAGSNVDLFASIDEATAADADYIQSPANPVNETCRIGLSNPGGALGQPFIVRYRVSNEGGASLRVRLMQASTVIASWTETAEAWTTAERTLTAPQFALITDADNLVIELTANTIGDVPANALILNAEPLTLNGQVLTLGPAARRN